MPAVRLPAVKAISKCAVVVAFALSATACTKGDRNAALKGSAVGAAVGGVNAAVRDGAILSGAIIGATVGGAITLITRPLRRALP